MKKISIILISLLITFSYEGTIALTDCEIKNDDTTKTKAVVSCQASATIAEHVFVDNYLKLGGKTETSKSASLASCAAATCGAQDGTTSLFPCTFTCSKVTSEEKDVAYILKAIDTGAKSGVFSGSNSGNDVTLAIKADSTSVYTGQAAAASGDTTKDEQKNDEESESSTFIKYTLLLLNILLF